MELTERERGILAELEKQFPARSRRRMREPALNRGIRPHWTVLPSAVLGILLLLAGVVLTVPDAGLMGVLLVGWWTSPRLVRGTRRFLSYLAADGPRR